MDEKQALQIHPNNCGPKNKQFCETRWRHSVKTRSYKAPTPKVHCISQLGENKGDQGHCVSENILYKIGW